MDLDDEPLVDATSVDVEEQYIKNLLWKNKRRIAAAPNDVAEATYILYEHIYSYVRKIVDVT